MELEVFETPGQEWDEFASRFTDLIFYQSIWSDVLRKGLGAQPLYFCLKDRGRIVAGLPGILFRFSMFKIYYASIPYGNVLGEAVFFPALMESLEEELRRKGIDQVRITESPFGVSFPIETFSTVPARCSLLDLRPLDEKGINGHYRSDVRRAIRKAQNKGLVVKGTTSPEEALIFNRLYLASMERNQAGAKYPLRWFQTLYEMLIRQGKGDFRFALQGDQYAAGVALVYSSTSVHYLHNGSLPGYLENRPNDLIVDDIIRQGIREKKAFLDFMGSDPGDTALLHFKEKWGSRSRDLMTYTKDYHPLKCFLWETGKRWLGSGFLGTVFRWIRK